ncbi:MAG: 6-phosphofructokinase [Candidatus Hydrothermia bacterium]
MKKFGVMTSGGDCPGLNAALRAIVRRAKKDYSLTVIGFMRAWEGLLEGEFFEMDYRHVSGILPLGGTILHTTRKNLLEKPGTMDKVLARLDEPGLDGLIIIGGDGTLHWAWQLHRRWPRVVAIPKTIDNDVWGTRYSIGFDTAVSVAVEALDRLHTTAESHDRVFVVDVMGRATGWIAIHAGIAGGADVIVIPEHPLREDEILQIVDERRARGKSFSIIIVAEGVHYVGMRDRNSVTAYLAGLIESGLGISARTVKLDYVLRGGTPTSYDRLLATRMGFTAVDLLVAGKFGVMTSLRGTQIASVPIQRVVGRINRVDENLWAMARTFFG